MRAADTDALRAGRRRPPDPRLARASARNDLVDSTPPPPAAPVAALQVISNLRQIAVRVRREFWLGIVVLSFARTISHGMAPRSFVNEQLFNTAFVSSSSLFRWLPACSKPIQPTDNEMFAVHAGGHHDVIGQRRNSSGAAGATHIHHNLAQSVLGADAKLGAFALDKSNVFSLAFCRGPCSRCVFTWSLEVRAAPLRTVSLSVSAERFYSRFPRVSDSTRSRDTVRAAFPLVTCPRRARQTTRLTRLLRPPSAVIRLRQSCRHVTLPRMASLCKSPSATAGGAERSRGALLSPPVKQYAGFRGRFAADIPSWRILSPSRVRAVNQALAVRFARSN